MRKFFVQSVLFIGSILSCYMLFAEENEIFDKGGVTFDFQKISDQRFKEKKHNKDGHSMPLETTILPMAFLDNTFCLSQNDPAIMIFAWKRNISKEQFKLSSPLLCVELPEAVQIRGVGENLKFISSERKTIDGKAYRLYKIDMRALRQRPLQTEDYDETRDYSMLLFANAEAFTVLGDGFYQVIDKDIPVSEKKNFHLKIIPPVKITGKRPFIFMNGFHVWNYMNYPGTENRELLGRFIKNTGTGIVSGYLDPIQAEVFRRNEIKTVLSVSGIRNGYSINSTPFKIDDKPEYAKFKTIGKSISNHINCGTCPVAIYKESEFFKKTILPYLEEKIKGFDGLIANWEPYHFAGKGCFCENCRDEFINYSKIPVEEIKTAWPQEMLAGKKHYELWRKFRSFQHAQVIKVLNKAVDSFSSGKIGFVPEISYVTMVDSEKGRDFGAEYDPLDYAAELKYIEPWGPYPHWASCKPYFYIKGANLSTFAIAQKVRAFTDKNFPDTARKPELIAFPTGYQPYGEQWVTQPEAISMDVLSFFLNRYKSAVIFYFSKGYDNRYWAAYANTSDLIGEYEEYVFKGSRFDGISLSPVTPYPDTVNPLHSKAARQKFFPEDVKLSMLQSIGYKFDAKYLIAVGNFWEKGNVFFKLTVKGLDGNTRYVVRSPDKKCYFAGEKNDSFSAGELEKGILLHAGALRWAFFVIEPFNGKMNYGKKITPLDVNAGMNKHLPEIKKAADIEQENDKLDNVENKNMELKALKYGKLSCTPVYDNKGKQNLKFTSGNNELLINLDGMAIKSWKVQQKELVASDINGNLGLGLPTFWSPVVFPLGAYQIKKLAAIDSGIVVVAEHPIKNEAPDLQYITIKNEMEISEDCLSARIKTELFNNSSDENGAQDFIIGFRYHNILKYFEGGGSIIMKNGTDEISFVRKFERKIFGMTNSEASSQIAELFKADASEIKINVPRANCLSKDSDISVKMELIPIKNFAGFAVWDGVDIKSPSFEPFFEVIKIKSQESASFSIYFKVEQ